MRSFARSLVVLALTTLPVIAAGQQLPPIEPPQAMPSATADTTVLHVTTNEVLVPTLVEKRDGGIVYGLKAPDFQVEDNGIPQKIHVQEEMDTAPVALVVAVQQGGASALEFDKIARLGPLLDVFLSDARSRAALIGFDSRPQLIHDFTHSTEDLNQALRNLEPGDGGASILDTVSYGVDLLEAEPETDRRVLLLISERRDHGSKYTRPEQLIRKIGRSNVLILSISFSPSGAELMHDVQDSGDDRTLNMVSALVMAVKAFKKNVAREIAQESGGEYTTFVSDKRFEQRVVDAAKHMRNRYLITFSPSDATPGLHTIRVQTTAEMSARIVARSNYWLQAQP